MNEKKRNWQKWWDGAWRRAVRTIAQTLLATIPAGLVVTPTMIANFDISILYAVLAWLATGILAGGLSLLTSLAGIPEEE